MHATNTVTGADVLRLLPLQKGHFRFESGHHSDTWIDLETLCLRPEAVETLAATLSERIAKYDIEAVCGPLVEGAFVALMVASRLRVLFTYAERFERPSDELYPVQYRVPRTLRPIVRGKRTAIINDVTSAGSAVRGTLADLLECGANPVVVGTLAVLGDTFVKQNKLPLETLVSLPNEIWKPAECPLCARGVALR
ncbi:MAG: orotate phosphoribosyltransferase [Thermoanaerobaculia bacterium]